MNAEHFPAMYGLSAGLLRSEVVPVYTGPPLRPEMILVPVDRGTRGLETTAIIASWNMYWEAGPYRPEHIHDRMPKHLAWLEVVAERHADVVLVGVDKGSEYDAYAPLYHLIPERLVRRHRLPVFARGHWPRTSTSPWHQMAAASVPAFRRALADTIWPALMGGRSGVPSHPADESIVVLAHNPGFWLPAMEIVLRRRGRRWGRAQAGPTDEERMAKIRRELPSDLDVQRPARGGPMWTGEAEAREVVRELIDVADEHGHLRAAIDAIRSHRVEEDFSARWSREREDFERKLYSKRAKVQTTFVEIDDTLPLVGAESEVEENLLWRDVMAIVEPRDRRVVVLLQRGHTAVGDIAEELGYANHSPVSKALARIRAAVAQMFTQ